MFQTKFHSPEAEAQMFESFCKKIVKAIEAYEGALIAFVVIQKPTVTLNSTI